MQEGEGGDKTHALHAHEHGQHHGGAAADACRAVEADGLVAREEWGAEVAYALEVGGGLRVRADLEKENGCLGKVGAKVV